MSTDYNSLETSEVAHEYLRAKEEAKAVKDRQDKAKAVLDARLVDGDEVDVKGTLHRWSVSVGKAPAYKKAIDWVMARVTPDVQVMLEEAVGATTGSKTTKDLKPVD